MEREDRDRLIRIEAWQSNFDEKWEENILPRLNDHGKRIRALETGRNILAGAVALGSAILAAVKLKVSLHQ